MQAPEISSTHIGQKFVHCPVISNRPLFRKSWLAVFLGLLLVGGLTSSARARGLPVQQGILNFGKVSDHLYRGAQPDGDGLRNLKSLGVKLIVNLRMPGDSWNEEAAQAAACGILYTNFPMSGRGMPKDEQVRQILALFESFSDPIFVHCQHGCDRTGTIVACYRIQHDHWTGELALREAKRYGISRLEFFMRKYIVAFARSSTPAQPVDLRQAKAN